MHRIPHGHTKCCIKLSLLVSRTAARENLNNSYITSTDLSYLLYNYAYLDEIFAKSRKLAVPYQYFCCEMKKNCFLLIGNSNEQINVHAF